MNKNALKRFATSARRLLAGQVIEILLHISRQGLGERSNIDPEILGFLRKAGRKDCDRIAEEAAYHWFMVVVIVHLLEKQGYPGAKLLPAHQDFVQVQPEGAREILDEKDQLFCRHFLTRLEWLTDEFPFLADGLPGYLPSLLPRDRRVLDGVIQKLLEEIPDSDWQDPTIVGWLHQYYWSEAQGKLVGINKGRVTAEEITVATQWFTPDWIVRYLVENSLGHLLLARYPYLICKVQWPFYLGNGTTEPGATGLADEIAQIRVIDPACGAGHMLAYCFDVLYSAYLALGYSAHDSVNRIISDNLMGLDIDPKTVKIARLVLFLKAWRQDVTLKAGDVQWNVMRFMDTAEVAGQRELLLAGITDIDTAWASRQVELFFRIFEQAREHGSLITWSGLSDAFWQERYRYFTGLSRDNGICHQAASQLAMFIKQALLLGRQYHVVITNPPYLGVKAMPASLKQYIAGTYSGFSQDVFAAFMARSFTLAKPGGYIALLTPFVWMFIKSYQQLRQLLIQDKHVCSLVQLEYGAFKEAVVPLCLVVVENACRRAAGIFIDLSEYKGMDRQPEKVLAAVKQPNVPYRYQVEARHFAALPGQPFAYWADEAIRTAFRTGTPLGQLADVRQGLATADNKRFLRYWFEVAPDSVGFGCLDRQSAQASGKRWFPYNKGGEYRKWYGNNLYVILWENDGEALKSHPSALLRNQDYYFRQGITWSFVSSAKFGARFSPPGSLFDVGGSTVFAHGEELFLLLGLLCSRLGYRLLKMLNPTLNFQVGNVASLPVIMPRESHVRKRIVKLVQDNIEIARADWDSCELSWDFTTHPLLLCRCGAPTVEEAFNNWARAAAVQRQRMLQNETELDWLYARLYGLDTNSVRQTDKLEITLGSVDLQRGIRSFFSYAVGCILGRYVLDIGQTGQVSCKPKEWVLTGKCMGQSESDHISPAFQRLLGSIFGADTLLLNMEYIANSLGKKPWESAQERIRRYFDREFFQDHVRMYKKRPIYWLFSCDSQFRALTYVHRLSPRVLRELYDELQWLNDGSNGCIDERNRYLTVLGRFLERPTQIVPDDGIKVNYQRYAELLHPLDD